MLPYQLQYIENAREITSLNNLCAAVSSGFDEWYAAQRQARLRIEALRSENISLLGDNLFPLLDDLHNASDEDIAALEEFAAKLMDWTTNLDIGTYVLIHDSLLSLYRIRKDRNRIIRQLYMLGMGIYYQNRAVTGLNEERTREFYFRNELLFTEAGSYIKFFEQIDDEATRGYVIRALANIGIATTDLKRRIAIGSRVLAIVQDDYYRSLAPNLPWETFRRRTAQQMSSNRKTLSRGGLTTEELAAVLEACHEVFKPESIADSPNIRWVWPYYEMEYTCGFVDLATTLSRLEHLIEQTPFDQYDESGLYGSVQLAIYYGRLVKANPALQTKAHHMRFLAAAYRKMLHTLVTYPADRFSEQLLYNVTLVMTDYFECDGVPTYREISSALLQRYAGRLYLRGRRMGDVLCLCCRTILRSEPDFFDDIDFIRAVTDPREKEAAVLDYAAQCGVYADCGLVKMGMERFSSIRNLYESEYRIWQMHVFSGSDDLRRYPSTAAFADVALGHHRWYDGSDGFPDEYVRTASPYRQMTDVAAVAEYLLERAQDDPEEVFASVMALGGRRFSPLVTAFFADGELRRGVTEILRASDEPYYREVYRGLTGEA